MLDCVVIGQGIAGTCLAHALLEHGLNIKIYSDLQGHTASILAAGVINPVTGRRFVKTWKAETLLPMAMKWYRELGEKLGIDCITERRILHALNSPNMEENWLLRSGDPSYASYLGELIRFSGDQRINCAVFGELFGGLQVDMEGLIRKSEAYFIDLGILKSKVIIRDTIKESLNLTAKHDTKHIIFCEGVHVKDNPLFDWLPNMVSKGEVLICRIPDLKSEDIIKDGVSIVPFNKPGEKDVYWIGSTYEWDNYDETPTEKAHQNLKTKLENAIKCDFTILKHWAGLRPTAKDRRPFVGPHPDYPNIHILNGLGTKGASLAPYCAELLADHIASGSEIPAEVNILRYYKR